MVQHKMKGTKQEGDLLSIYLNNISSMLKKVLAMAPITGQNLWLAGL